MWSKFAAIVKVISLKWVQHNTRPIKTTTWKIKNTKIPLFHADSCSYSTTFKYNLRNKWIQEKTINNAKKPNKAWISWKLTDITEK